MNLGKLSPALHSQIGTTINRASLAKQTLRLSGHLWFLIAIAGQWVFAYYVASFYGGSALQGNLEAWSNVLPEGMIAGDVMGNFALAGHLLLAVIIIFLGPLQFIPAIRKHFPQLHRINGRIYLITCFITSIFGLYMVWTRGTVGGLVQHLGVSFNAVLIIAFGLIALSYILKKDIKNHNRWAFRMFLAVSGVWFFRVGLMFWIFVNDGPVGFDPETFEGPFLSFWSFGQYLLPLALLELYYFCKDHGSTWVRFAMSLFLSFVTAAMGLGIFVAIMGMWLPRL
ncbi:MAG: DUF2306 domain-containing protein [Fulvivirga sp.]|nr:DUF2306 domain-containing protein [Fulvivirga sp.]